MTDESRYLYPGTDVLRNKFDIRDGRELTRMELRHTKQRLEELHERPIRGEFDAKHVRAIHHYIFQDVYEWAGDFRETDITKDPKGRPQFSHFEEINYDLKIVTSSLKRDDHLRNVDRITFCERAAYHLGELNTVHPFREGNGRTQAEFFRLLAEEAGHPLDWTLARPGEFTAARERYTWLKNQPARTSEFDLGRRTPEEFLERLFLNVTAQEQRSAEPPQESARERNQDRALERERAADTDRAERERVLEELRALAEAERSEQQQRQQQQTQHSHSTGHGRER